MSPTPLKRVTLSPSVEMSAYCASDSWGSQVGATVHRRPVIYPVNYAVHQDASCFEHAGVANSIWPRTMPWRPLRSTVRTTSTTRDGVCWSWGGLVASATLQSSPVSKMSVFRRGRVRIVTVLCASPLMRSAVGISITEQPECRMPSAALCTCTTQYFWATDPCMDMHRGRGAQLQFPPSGRARSRNRGLSPNARGAGRQKARPPHPDTRKAPSIGGHGSAAAEKLT